MHFREKKEKEPALPRRSSLRLQRMDPMGIPLPEAPEREPQTIYEQVSVNTLMVIIHKINWRDLKALPTS